MRRLELGRSGRELTLPVGGEAGQQQQQQEKREDMETYQSLPSCLCEVHQKGLYCGERGSGSQRALNGKAEAPITHLQKLVLLPLDTVAPSLVVGESMPASEGS